MRSLIAVIVLLSLTPAWTAPAAAQATGVRDVTASGRSVIPLNTKLRYTTMILLPDGEEILDVICGDRDFWVISAAQNIAHVKPAKEGAATNLNLVTTSGTVYSFLLSEGKLLQPDLKVYVTADPAVVRTAKYVPAAQVTALQAELTEMRAAITAVRDQSQGDVATFQQDYPSSLRSPTARRSMRSRSSCGRSGTTASSPTSSLTRASCQPSTNCAMASLLS